MSSPQMLGLSFWPGAPGLRPSAQVQACGLPQKYGWGPTLQRFGALYRTLQAYTAAVRDPTAL